MKLWQILRTIGRYQWRLMALIVIFKIPEWSNFGIVVFVPDVDFKCLDYNITGNQCEVNNSTIIEYASDVSNGATEVKDSKCRNFEYDHSKFQWTLTERFDLVCDRKYIISLMKSAYPAGYFFGSIISGISSDKFGRRSILMVTSVCSAVLNIGLAFVPSVWAYLALRFVQAALEISTYLSMYVLCTESVRKEQRMIPKFLDSTNYDVFGVILGLLCFVFSNYVYYHLLFVAMHVVMFCWAWAFVLESPRWLKAKNMDSKFQTVLTKIAKVNKSEMDEIEYFKENSDDEVKDTGNWLDMFRTPLIRKRSLVICPIWFVFVLSYYAITYNLGAFSSDVRISLIISGGIEVLSTLPMALLMKRFGRSMMLFVTLLIAGVCCLAMAPLVTHKTFPYVITALALTGKLMLSNTFFIIYVYTPELYPTVIRGTGLGVCSTVARVVSIIGPQLLLVNDYWPPFMVVTLGVLVLLVSFLVPLLPDTSNVELAQTIEDGERLLPNHGYGLRKTVVDNNKLPSIDIDLKDQHEFFDTVSL